jgi:hypothetical protein
MNTASRSNAKGVHSLILDKLIVLSRESTCLFDHLDLLLERLTRQDVQKLCWNAPSTSTVDDEVIFQKIDVVGWTKLALIAGAE